MIITCHGSLGLSELILVPARWNSGNNFKLKKILIVYFSLLQRSQIPRYTGEINDQLIKVSINVCVVRMSVSV